MRIVCASVSCESFESFEGSMIAVECHAILRIESIDCKLLRIIAYDSLVYLWSSVCTIYCVGSAFGGLKLECEWGMLVLHSFVSLV